MGGCLSRNKNQNPDKQDDKKLPPEPKKEATKIAKPKEIAKKKPVDTKKLSVEELAKYLTTLEHKYELFMKNFDDANDELKRFPKNVNKKNFEYKDAAKKALKCFKKVKSTKSKIKLIEKQLENIEVEESTTQFALHARGATNILEERRKRLVIANEDIRIAGEENQEFEQVIKENDDVMNALESDEEDDELFEELEEMNREAEAKLPDPRTIPKPAEKKIVTQTNTGTDKLLAELLT